MSLLQRRQPIRVLHLLHWMTTGGIERWVLNMIRHTDRTRFQIDVCCKGPDVGVLAPLAEHFGARIWHIPLDWSHTCFVRRLSQLLRDQQYNVLHNHTMTYAGVGAYAAKRVGCPTITTFHNTNLESDVLFNPLLRRVRALYGAMSIPLALRWSRFVTACSQEVAGSVAQRYAYALDVAKLQVLYLGVPLPKPLTSEARVRVRQSLGVRSDVPLIIHVGRFSPQKNHRGLLDIATEVVARSPEAVFLLIGEGPLFATTAQDIAARGLEGHVRLLGRRDDVEALMQAADIFCLPSLWEGLPLAAMEAGAARLPIVATQLSGLQEAVIDGTTGILLPVEATHRFADAICALLDNPQQRKAMGNGAYERTEALFSSAVSLERHQQLYRACLSKDVYSYAISHT